MTRGVTLSGLALAVGSLVVGSLVVTGCSTATSAPTTPSQDPTALTIAFVGGLADEQIAHFQAELARRSGGALVTRIDPELAASSLTMEQRMVEAVADGRLDLAVVGARAFRELGIHDLDALIAPMAVDSMAAQEAVLASELPDRMLAGLESGA